MFIVYIKICDNLCKNSDKKTRYRLHNFPSWELTTIKSLISFLPKKIEEKIKQTGVKKVRNFVYYKYNKKIHKIN